MTAKRTKRNEYEIALAQLGKISALDERGRIELLIEQQDKLNNGDAMAFFGHWLDAVCVHLEIEFDEPVVSDEPWNSKTTEFLYEEFVKDIQKNPF